MIRSNQFIFVILSLMIISTVSASMIRVSPGTITGIGQAGSVDVSLDSAENGLSGYILSVYSENPQIVAITGATFPSWASLSDVSEGQGAAYTIKALDLNESLSSGASNIPLATLNLNAISVGSTRIMIEVRQVDDDQGGAIQAETSPGTVTVGSSTGQSLNLNLKPGWNFISIPMTLQPGTDTAEIFKDIPSEGHSVFTYDGVNGWKTLRRTEVLNAMTAYWIYSTKEMSIPLKTSGQQISSRVLNAGWSIIGIPGSSSQPAATALSSPSDWTYLIGFDASLQQYEQPIIKGGSGQNSDQKILNPGVGYWIYLSAPGKMSP